MRKTLIAAGACLAVVAVPAPAQPETGHGFGDISRQERNISKQLRDYEAHIRGGVRIGRWSPRDGDRLLRQISAIRQLFEHYRQGGLTFRERIELRDRTHNFRETLRATRPASERPRPGRRN